MIYKYPKLYEFAIKLLYGKNYKERYEIIARESENLKVLDLCCGDCKLAEFVKKGYKS